MEDWLTGIGVKAKSEYGSSDNSEESEGNDETDVDGTYFADGALYRRSGRSTR
jgi:hypothetical protein